MLWSMAWPRIQHLLVFFFPYLNDCSFSVLVGFSQPLSVDPRTQTLVFSLPRSFILMTLKNIHWIIIPILIPWASDSYICLLSSSTWTQNRHSKFNLSKTEILIFVSPTIYPLDSCISANSNSIHLLSQDLKIIFYLYFYLPQGPHQMDQQTYRLYFQNVFVIQDWISVDCTFHCFHCYYPEQSHYYLLYEFLSGSSIPAFPTLLKHVWSY